MTVVVVVVVVHVQAADHIHSPLCTVLPLLLHATYRYLFNPNMSIGSSQLRHNQSFLICCDMTRYHDIDPFEIDYPINISGKKHSFVVFKCCEMYCFHFTVLYKVALHRWCHPLQSLCSDYFIFPIQPFNVCPFSLQAPQC